MRIVFVNEWLHAAGGIESYLRNVLPLFQKEGHEIRLLCEHIGDSSRTRIFQSADEHTWVVDDLKTERALAYLKSFDPHVIFVHGIENPELERALITAAPSVRFLHSFRGTCISSFKTRNVPVSAPCDRQFGPGCLLQYFPRRCGGIDPRTMLRLYALEKKRQHLLRQYTRVICASEYMASELAKHDIPAVSVGLFVRESSSPGRDRDCDRFLPQTKPDCWNLAFIGRMEHLKGCHLLIKALPQVRCDRPIRVRFVGDGRERCALQGLAEEQLRPRGIDFQFTGWLNADQLETLLPSLHLVVVPSVWPEPFGLVGLEAGLHSVPAVAFDVGGIRDWLSDGFNGFLADSHPPSSTSLASAITKALADEDVYRRLRLSSNIVAQAFDKERHFKRLWGVLDTFAEVKTQANTAELESQLRRNHEFA